MYVYSFSVWPDETRNFPVAVYDLFRVLNGRVELPMTQSDFQHFRACLAAVGLTLREVERVPHADPEPIL